MNVRGARENSHHNRRHIRFLTLLSFGMGFLDSFFLYIISSYFVAVSGSENVSGFYLVTFLIVLAFLLNLSIFIQRFGRVRLFYLLLVGLVLSAALLSLNIVSWPGALLLLCFLVFNNVLWVLMDILVEHYSVDHVSGRVRGLYLTIVNTGFLIAPFLATQTLERLQYGGVFFVLTLGYASILGLALFGLERPNHSRLPAFHFGATWRRLRERPNVARIYGVSFALEFFYVIMIIYMPIYLRTRFEYSWEELGVIFTVMLIPFVLLQYPLGRLADRRFGEKELLLGSLFLLALSNGMILFVESRSLLIWGTVLLLTRIGAASIEILRDSYFYKQVTVSDADLIAFFRTARPLANIVGAVFTFFFLFFFSLQWIFVLVVLVSGLAFVAGLRLRDTESEGGASLARVEGDASSMVKS